MALTRRTAIALLASKKQLFPLGPIYPHWPAVNSQSFNHWYHVETRK